MEFLEREREPSGVESTMDKNCSVVHMKSLTQNKFIADPLLPQNCAMKLYLSLLVRLCHSHNSCYYYAALSFHQDVQNKGIYIICKTGRMIQLTAIRRKIH